MDVTKSISLKTIKKKYQVDPKKKNSNPKSTKKQRQTENGFAIVPIVFCVFEFSGKIFFDYYD